jgi:plastocyanin
MKVYRYLAAFVCLFGLLFLLTSFIVSQETKIKVKNDVCSGSNPASICAELNTCGSVSSPCTIDIRRSGDSSATAKPSIPDAKANKAFCIKVGTPVTFSTSSGNIGFIIDFGKDNPFDHEGSIRGGSERSITVTAKHPGCYTYSIAACTPGTVHGMCGNANAQLVISAN